MKPVFDFGISQEDASTEQAALQLQPDDRLLCIARGGEVPLNLLCWNNGLRIDAVDVSEAQLALCRLKLLTALYIEAPDNAGFLGYFKMNEKKRIELFRDVLLPLLDHKDRNFWHPNIALIGKGVVNCGRFELYQKKIRTIGRMIIGGKNLTELIECSSLLEQEQLFDQRIATRKAVKYLFKIAFHPWIYRRRGLDRQGLQHASSRTGEMFYNRFRNFCTGTPASENYFLQYFLLGYCCAPAALPAYLQPRFKTILKQSQQNISFPNITFNKALLIAGKGVYNKIHMSNIGDWFTEEEFADTMNIILAQTLKNTRICYRFLQKNHFLKPFSHKIIFDDDLSNNISKVDRFPFYSTLIALING